MKNTVLGRFAGTFLLLTILTGIFAQVTSVRQLGFMLYLVEMACQVGYTVMFYQILRNVNGPIAQLALALGLVGCTVKLMSRLFYLAPLLIIGNVGGFEAEQQAGLAQLALALNSYGAGIALPFFGFGALLNGYLAFRSGFLPRALGVLSMIGGAGWLTFLNPSLGLRLFPLVVGVALLGSVSWILWLLIGGVRAGDSFDRNS